MDLTQYVPLIIPASIVALAVVARVAGDLATQSESKQASRVARIESAVSRVAGGIASDLMDAKAAGIATEALQTLKSDAIQEGAAYLGTAMPATLQKAGATPDIVAGMLAGELGKQAPGLVTSLLSAAAVQLLPNQASPGPLSPAPAAAAAG